MNRIRAGGWVLIGLLAIGGLASAESLSAEELTRTFPEVKGVLAGSAIVTGVNPAPGYVLAMTPRELGRVIGARFFDICLLGVLGGVVWVVVRACRKGSSGKSSPETSQSESVSPEDDEKTK